MDFACAKAERSPDKPTAAELASLAFHKRPVEELYDLRTDPFQLRNVVNDEAYADSLLILRKRLATWRENTHDPRLKTDGEAIEQYPYFGPSSNPQQK